MSAGHHIVALRVSVECHCGQLFSAGTEDEALAMLAEHIRWTEVVAESKRAHPTRARPRHFSDMPRGGDDE